MRKRISGWVGVLFFASGLVFAGDTTGDSLVNLDDEESGPRCVISYSGHALLYPYTVYIDGLHYGNYSQPDEAFERVKELRREGKCAAKLKKD